MSADTQGADGDVWSVLELREMDEETARQTLPMAEYERWEKLTEMWDGYEEQKQEWADTDEWAQEIVVHADPDDLGTQLDLYGNDVVVHPEQGEAELREAADEYEDIDLDGVDDLDPERKRDIEQALLEMLDAILLSFNGTPWESIPEDVRADTLAAMGDKWGASGLVKAYVDIVEAVREDHEEVAERMESFRPQERAGGRGNPPADRLSDVQ